MTKSFTHGKSTSASMARVRTPASERASLVGDFAVRQALHQKVLQDHWNDSETIVINELAICHGYARVDVAVVNGELHGFEIKSQLDSVARLAHQSHVYNGTLDRVTLVTHEKHIAHAIDVLPEWWGIKLITHGTRGGINFKTVRRSLKNPAIYPMALVEFLWRGEALRALEVRDQVGNHRRKTKQEIYERLVELLSLEDLRALVRSCLKNRPIFQAALPQR